MEKWTVCLFGMIVLLVVFIWSQIFAANTLSRWVLEPFIAPSSVLDVGSNSGYRQAAAQFSAAINQSADPCDDFFQFSCGKWVANNQIPSDLTSYGHLYELREKVLKVMNQLYEDSTPSSSNAINKLKHIFHSCMDIDALNNRKSLDFLEAVKNFGYWPVVHGNKWSLEDFDLTDLLTNIAPRATDVFIDISVSQDMKNVTRRLLHFDQGSLGLDSSAREYYLNKTRYAKQIKAYEKYINAIIQLFAEDVASGRTHEQIAADVRELLEFETEFAKILTPDEDRRNYSKLYNLRKLSDLDKLFPMINWDKYFRSLMPSEMHNYLNSNPDIIVKDIEFFERLLMLLQKTDKRIITNYILLRYTLSWTNQFDERFDNIHQEFLKDFIGRSAMSPRWKECQSESESRMIYASGAMYVRKYFNKEDRQAALKMIEDLRDAFRNMVLENDWMEEQTQQYALEKANNMASLIGFPDFLYNDTGLDDYYRKLVFEPSDNFPAIMEKVAIWDQRRAFQRLIEPVDRTEFEESSATVNAFYSAVQNAIMFPAAILQAPFFDRHYPKAINYGAIGAIIGHEITHGFDDKGSQLDKMGNLNNWWDEKTIAKFINRTQCIIDQYSAFEVPEAVGLKVNGILTQGENIADNGGVKEAFRAYRSYVQKLGREEKRLPGFEDYTNDQIFFISYAQVWCGHSKPEALIHQILVNPHSPMKFRVNGVLANQPEFAASFKCPLGSKMNPKKKCSVW
uniref:Uncharacterized protein n=1 Tax=Acrobeloides nanus TaxID=290746 RepID=A0A914CI21_9BILA